ncbi:serine O-acetyltransferase, partial [Bacillus paranthracis]|nr:serine O-acetyltransferase [Bacillus paranthracis]
MSKRIREDIEVVVAQDTAARSYFEVILPYYGVHVVWAHRIAHALYKKTFFFI